MGAETTGYLQAPHRLRILSHPRPQGVALPTADQAVFEVLAEPGAPLRHAGLSYQWEKSAALGGGLECWEPLKGQNGSKLVLSGVTTKDVGYYRVRVRERDEEIVSEPASLVVSEPSESIIVFGAPTLSNGNAGPTCPGAYAGYVTYAKDPGWGWSPAAAGPWEVQDRGDTKGFNAIEAVEFFSGTRHCAPFGETKLRFPAAPAPGSLWRFAIYFPVGGPLPGSGPYQIYLKNFD